MKTIWVFVLMTVMIVISCEAATGPNYATKGVRRGNRREQFIYVEPEEVDLLVSFPENEEKLKTEDIMHYIPEKKVTKRTSEIIANDEEQATQKLFKTKNVTIICPSESPTNMYFTFSDHSWGAQFMLASMGSIMDYGDLEAKFVLHSFKDVKINLNSSTHGWDPDCLRDLESTNNGSRFAIGGVVVCARMHGFLKEMDRGLLYLLTRSVACVEVLTSKSQFGIIMCVVTPVAIGRPPPSKVLCCLDSVKYINSKGQIDTVPDVTQKQYINQKCGKEHGPDIQRMLFDVFV